MRTLVTGGVRSGKSRHAELLLEESPATYIAAGPSPGDDADPDWLARITAHQERRPPGWTTVESTDPASVIAAVQTPVLLDCLGTWLTATIDAASADGAAWSWSTDRLADVVDEQCARLAAAIAAHRHDVVVVTNEVGLSVVPEHRSGRIFRDLLGTVNQHIATISDEVHLVICGRVLRL